MEPGGGVPEPRVWPGVETRPGERGECAGELHGIEEGVGGGGGLLVRHLRGSDHHHPCVTECLESGEPHSWGLSTWHSELSSPPVPVLSTNTKYQHQDSSTMFRPQLTCSLDNNYFSGIMSVDYRHSVSVKLTQAVVVSMTQPGCVDPLSSARDVSQCLNPTFH